MYMIDHTPNNTGSTEVCTYQYSILKNEVQYELHTIPI